MIKNMWNWLGEDTNHRKITAICALIASLGVVITAYFQFSPKPNEVKSISQQLLPSASIASQELKVTNAIKEQKAILKKNSTGTKQSKIYVQQPKVEPIIQQTNNNSNNNFAGINHGTISFGSEMTKNNEK
jgi:hypothetical protein